jgi:hypothetical protein
MKQTVFFLFITLKKLEFLHLLCGTLLVAQLVEALR